MLKKISIVFIFLLVLTGCTVKSTNSLNSLSLGMTKQEVISVMGSPDTTKATQDVEYLIYRLSENRGACATFALATFGFGLGLDHPDCSGIEYFVKLKTNSVVSYGRIGDFDSSK